MQILKRVGKVILVLMLSLVFFLLLLYRGDLSADFIESKYQTPQSTFLNIDGQNIHVRFLGEGEPIFLIHGSFSSLHTWDTWQQELSPYFLTIALDLPGHGLTGPNELKAYSITDYSDLVLRIADKLGLEEFHIAGNSMGGAVAMQVASDRSDLVKTLHLVNSAGAPPRVKSPKSLDKENSRGGGAWIFDLARNPFFSKILLKCTPRFLFAMNMKEVYYDDKRISEEVIDRYFELMLREGNRQATLDRLTSPRNTNIEFDRLKMPTLITWGKHDTWIPVGNGEALKEMIPGSILKVYDNAGHVPMEEIPTESVAEYISFLGVEIRKDYLKSSDLISYGE